MIFRSLKTFKGAQTTKNSQNNKGTKRTYQEIEIIKKNQLIELKNAMSEKIK